MKVPPTVDQFPSFVQTHSWLAKQACRCIWYLPDRERCCFVRISNADNQSALRLIETVSKPSSQIDKPIQLLADIAEQCCCACFHRNKIWGNDLDKALAIRWYNEIQDTNNKITPMVKLKIQNNFYAKFPDTDKPVVFAKHEVLGETLCSKLLSSIDSRQKKSGSIYIFTHAKDAFQGMIKIGYTCRPIETRLSEWAECGHGDPVLLDSFRGIRYPERVELLTHFELIEYWHAQRWCKLHCQAHIEWFKIDRETASSIASLWSTWMERANPYDRRGSLKAFWKNSIVFLARHDVPITAKIMMEIQEIEEGSIELSDFLDDDELRKKQEPAVKRELFD